MQAGQFPTTLKTVLPSHPTLDSYLEPQFAFAIHLTGWWGGVGGAGGGGNCGPELFLHSLDLWFPKKGDPDVRAPPLPQGQETPHWPSYTLRIHGGLILSTPKLCPGAVSTPRP